MVIFQFVTLNNQRLSASGCVGKASWAPFLHQTWQQKFARQALQSQQQIFCQGTSEWLFWDGMQCSGVLLYTEFRWHFVHVFFVHHFIISQSPRTNDQNLEFNSPMLRSREKQQQSLVISSSSAGHWASYPPVAHHAFGSNVFGSMQRVAAERCWCDCSAE